MPVYQLKCENGHIFDRFLKLANYNDPQICECGSPAKRQITAPMIAPMFEDYQSPIDGRPITSKRKRLDDMARSNCIEYDPGMLQDNNERIKRQEAELDKKIDSTVEKEIMNMSSEKRERLAHELSTSDVQYTRLNKE